MCALCDIFGQFYVSTRLFCCGTSCLLLERRFNSYLRNDSMTSPSQVEYILQHYNIIRTSIAKTTFLKKIENEERFA